MDLSNIKKPFRVLSLDGGGIRGLYTLSLLETLIKRFNGDTNDAFDLGERFDLIVGTSTGGILACAIATGIPLAKIKTLYQQYGTEIFQNPLPKNIFSKILWWCRSLFKPANSNENLQMLLKSIFGDMTIEELYKKRQIALCLTAVNMMTYIPRVFKTPHNPEKILDNRRKIWELCLATSAAPILFPLAKITSPSNHDVVENFVDGGLWANNPVLIGIVEAKEMSQGRPIEIISLGTCSPPRGKNIKNGKPKEGIRFWKGGIEILEVSMEAQAKANNYIAKFLAPHLGVKIIRPQLHSPSSEIANCLSLDDASKATCALLINLGHHDAMMVTQDQHVYKELENILTNLSILK